MLYVQVGPLRVWMILVISFAVIVAVVLGITLGAIPSIIQDQVNGYEPHFIA